MSDPERLLQIKPTDELSSLEQELLRSLEPTPGQKDELWRSLAARSALVASTVTATSVLANSANAAAGAAGASAAKTASAGLLSTVSAKVITVAALVALPVVGAGSYLAFNQEEAASRPTRAPEPAEADAAPAGVEEPVKEEKVKSPDPVSAPPVPRTTAPGRARPAGVARSASSSLAEEDRLLRKARTEFKQGNLEAALGALKTLETRHPDGILAQEREVLRIAILKEQGQKKQAEERAQSFRERYPDSPYEADGRATDKSGASDR